MPPLVPSTKINDIVRWEHIANNISNYNQWKAEIDSFCQLLKDNFYYDRSMYVINNNLTNMTRDISLLKDELYSNNRVQDHIMHIFNHLDCSEYGDLKETLIPFNYLGPGKRFRNPGGIDEIFFSFDQKRMLDAHELAFSGLYGKISILLDLKDFFSLNESIKIENCIKKLDREYCIYKHVAKQYREYSDTAYNLTNEWYNIQKIKQEFDYWRLALDAWVDLPPSSRRGAISVLKGEVNLAYLAELPFYQGEKTVISSFIDTNSDNLFFLQQLPDANPDNSIGENIDIVKYTRGGNEVIENTNLYSQADNLIKPLHLLEELPYANIETDIQSEENMYNFSNLPFSNLETDTEPEENLENFSNLPFANMDTDTESEENLENFSELPFDLTEDDFVVNDDDSHPWLETALDVLEAVSNIL